MSLISSKSEELKYKSLLGQLKESDGRYIVDPEDEITSDFVHFYFLGRYEGKDTIFDVALYTLQMHYISELYEIAEQEATKRFPEFKSMNFTNEVSEEEPDFENRSEMEEEIGLFMAEVVMELEEEDVVKVREHIDVDESNLQSVGLDVGLNVDEINEECISQFIEEYISGTIALDETYYTFKNEDT